MLEEIQRHLIYFWYYFSIQFQQIFRYWVLGMALGSFISVFCKNLIYRMFLSLRNKNIGVLGIICASLLGIASPLCMYGTVPIAASFALMGADNPNEERKFSVESLLASFMTASILLNPQILFYSAALGIRVLVIRFVSCFLCGVTAGLLVNCFYKKKQFFDFSRFCSNEQLAENKEHLTIKNRDIDPNIIMRFLKNLGRNVKATGLFFLAGVALSALFQCYVPAEGFARIFGSNRGFGLLMAATVGVPLYVCGGGTIPLLQMWLSYGMSTGSAAAFMITGPAAKITNLGALKIVLGFKHFFFYLLFAFAFALLSGFAVDLVF